jgi:hypothetical protein
LKNARPNGMLEPAGNTPEPHTTLLYSLSMGRN